MKKIGLTLVVTLLVGVTSTWAQSAGSQNSNAGRQGSSTMNNARKANTGQTQGKGVPYNKDKEQQQSRSEAKGGTPTSNGASSASQNRKSATKARTSSPRSGSSQ